MKKRYKIKTSIALNSFDHCGYHFSKRWSEPIEEEKITETGVLVSELVEVKADISEKSLESLKKQVEDLKKSKKNQTKKREVKKEKKVQEPEPVEEAKKEDLIDESEGEEKDAE